MQSHLRTLVGAALACAVTTAAVPAAAKPKPGAAPPTPQGPAAVLPPRAGAAFRSVDAGVREWWAAELAAGGLALVPRAAVDALVAEQRATKPVLGSADAPLFAEKLKAGLVFTTELAYSGGDAEIWMRAVDAKSATVIGVGHAQGKLARLGELVAEAAEPLRKLVKLTGELEVARLPQFASYEQAADALAAKRPADAYAALTGMEGKAAEGLRKEAEALAQDNSVPLAERSRFASATGGNDRDWLLVRQGLIDGLDAELVLAGAANAESRGDHARALELFQQALLLAPGDPRATSGTARALDELARYADAAKAWQRVLDNDPNHLEAHKALSTNPTLTPSERARAALTLGQLQMQRLDVGAAHSAFEQAAKISPPAQAEARLRSAELAAKLGEHEEALLGFEKLAELEPSQLGEHQGEALAGLGRARARAGDAPGALQAYERALGVDPANPVALQGQGAELLRAGKAAEAIAPLARAIELAPEDPATRRELAEAHQKAGDPAAALRVLDPEAVALEDRPQILLKAAEIQTAQGDLAAAQVTLKSAVAIAPDDAPLHSALAKVYADAGQAEAASQEQAQIALLTGVSLKASDAEQEAAEKAKTVANGFSGLAASFPVAREDGTPYARVIFLGLGRKPSRIELVREWVMPRTLNVAALEAALRQALDARFGLAELIPVSEPARPALGRLQSLSTERVDIAVVNEELAADATLAAWLSAPEPVTMKTPAGAPIQVEVRMFMGHVSDDVQILAGALRLENASQFVHWNVRALVPYSLLLALLAFPFVRGWGRLVVKLDYQHRKEAKGFFSIVISRRPGRATHEKEKAGASKVATYQRRGRAWSRFARHMVERETLFRLIPARHYYVCVHGIMQDDRGEVVGNYLEERRVRIPRGKTVEVGFDFRPKEATLEVRLQRPPTDKAGVARVVLRGVPGSLKFVKDDVAIFYVGKGRHVVSVGFGDCAFEREVEVRELVAQQVTIGLADPQQAIFRGVPEAIEPFLTGDLAQCARALDKAGMSQKANELRAKYHEQRGDKAEAAKFHKAAGNLTQAAELVADAPDRTQSAELYSEAGDFKRAAAAFSEAGEHAKAADAYEKAFEFADAVDAYRNAGNTEKVLELLERLGRHHEAGAAALQLGDADRAIRNFQQVDLRDPDYGESCRALSELFAAREEWALALDKLREAIASAGEDAAPLELHEQLGDLLEKNGELAEALQVFENIRKRDYQYPQVADRIRALRELLHAAETIHAPATGASIASAGAATQPTPAAGAPLQDRYEILGELGRGGMGIVFKARDRRLGRVVALKRLPDNLRDHPTAVALFLREAQAAASLNHANIVTIYDADQAAGNYYLTMEFLEGFPLDAILRKRGKLTVKDTLRLGVQIATGMQFAHERGIVHRDIKTANLFFTRDRVVKIMDFGLAKMVEEVRRAATVVGGTPYYMAPEQAAGERVDHRADLYAFGVTLFEMLSGEVPFKEGDVSYHHRHTPPPELRELVPEVPTELAALVQQLMAKRPEDRPATTAEVVAALDGLLRHSD